MIVLDASAVLALLFREAGHERVGEVLHRACVSAVNLSEVILRFVRDGHDPQVVLERMKGAVAEVSPFLGEDAALAAALEPSTRAHGLSFADRACLALGLARSLPVMTADRAWSRLDLPLKIQLIR